MSEITNLNVYLKSNKYKDIILSLVKHFNDPTIRTVSPLEAIAIGAIMTERLLSWNNNGPIEVDYTYEICCCPSTTTSNSDCTWCKTVAGVVTTCCAACSADTATTSRYSKPQLGLRDVLTKIGADNKAGNPYTTFVTNFLQQMNGLSMNGTNDYIHFQQIRQIFFENVSMLDYILADKINTNIYMSMLGGYLRDGFNQSGLLVKNVSDYIPKAAQTIITCGGLTPDVAPGTEGPYVTVYTDVTKRTIIWWGPSGNGYVEPVVAPVSGVTDTYIQIIETNTDNGVKCAQELEGQLASVSDFTISRINNIVTLTLVKVLTTVPIGTFNFSVNGFLSGWEYTFIPAVASKNESTKISYKYASSVNELIGKWFKLFGAADNGVLFYYERPGYPIDPASFGTSYTTAIAIPLDIGCVVHPPLDGKFVSPCPTAQVAAEVKRLTSEAIIGTGLFTASAQEKCCDCAGRDAFGEPIPGCCGPCEHYTSVAAAALPNADSGTANYGANYQLVNVMAPDGTIFGSADDDLAYARLWNNHVVPYVKSLGQSIHYLAPVAMQSSLPVPCNPLKQSDAECYDRSNASLTSNTVGSLMLQTTHLAIVEDLPFNVPGNTYGIDINDRCPTCLT